LDFVNTELTASTCIIANLSLNVDKIKRGHENLNLNWNRTFKD